MVVRGCARQRECRLNAGGLAVAVAVTIYAHGDTVGGTGE